MADIFISYARNDRPLAEKLSGDLTARGYQVWWDIELLSGDEFRQIILDELRAAKAVIVIWSENSVKSRFVCDEADEGHRANKLIPVMVEGFDAAQIPLGFRGLNAIAVSGLDGIIKKLDKLAVQPAQAKTPVERGHLHAEVAFWDQIQDSTDAADFELYLAEFSNGAHRPNAKLKLRRLQEDRAKLEAAAPVAPADILAPQTNPTAKASETTPHGSWTAWLANLPQYPESDKHKLINWLCVILAITIFVVWVSSSSLSDSFDFLSITSASSLSLALWLLVNRASRLSGLALMVVLLWISASVAVLVASFNTYDAQNLSGAIVFVIVLLLTYFVIWHRAEKIGFIELIIYCALCSCHVVFMKPAFRYFGIIRLIEKRVNTFNIKDLQPMQITVLVDNESDVRHAQTVEILFVMSIAFSLLFLWRSRVLSQRLRSQSEPARS